MGNKEKSIIVERVSKPHKTTFTRLVKAYMGPTKLAGEWSFSAVLKHKNGLDTMNSCLLSSFIESHTYRPVT